MRNHKYREMELDEFLREHPEIRKLELFYFITYIAEVTGEHTEQYTTYETLDSGRTYIGLVEDAKSYVQSFAPDWVISDTLEEFCNQSANETLTQSYDADTHTFTAVMHYDPRDSDVVSPEVSEDSIWARSRIVDGNCTLKVMERSLYRESESLYDFLREHKGIHRIHHIYIRRFACDSHIPMSGAYLNYTFKRTGTHVYREYVESVSEFHRERLEMVEVGNVDGSCIRVLTSDGFECVRTVQIDGSTLHIVNYEDRFKITRGNLPSRVVELDTKILVAPYDISTGRACRTIEI